MRNRFPRLSVLCLFSALICGNALAANSDYLFDTLKKPAYRKAWNAMLASDRNIPPWLTAFSKTYNGVATPVETVIVGGKTYLSGYVCQPHACDGNALAVLFSENGGSATAVLLHDGKPRYLGAPDAAIKAALDNAVGR
jgi:hypothetical protein